MGLLLVATAIGAMVSCKHSLYSMSGMSVNSLVLILDNIRTFFLPHLHHMLLVYQKRIWEFAAGGARERQGEMTQMNGKVVSFFLSECQRIADRSAIFGQRVPPEFGVRMNQLAAWSSNLRNVGGFHIWRPKWVGEGAPKSRQKEQNQLICDSDKGGGGKKIAHVIYGSPLGLMVLIYPHQSDSQSRWIV